MPSKKINSHTSHKVILYIVLRILVVLVMIVQLMRHNYDNVFMCILTLVLFMIPTIVDKKFNIKLPTALEVVILLFIFAAEILGEIQNFYGIFKSWDTMLHTINGFLMAAIGFAMIDVLNQHPKFHITMSPLFVAFVAFCFSMTIGVLWEFFEYGMDVFTLSDMQKDFIIPTVSSVALNPEGKNVPIILHNIESTVINSIQNGQPISTVIQGGYLDIGLNDTMKDLLVNFVGAAVFSVIGMFYIQGRGGRVASSFIPQLKTQDEIDAQKLQDTSITASKKRKFEKKLDKCGKR